MDETSLINLINLTLDLTFVAEVLFIMLVGLPPFEFASPNDPRYRLVSQDGGLQRLVENWRRPISLQAVDLLQNMLREDPSERLSLFQVMNHPWVTGEEDNLDRLNEGP